MKVTYDQSTIDELISNEFCRGSYGAFDFSVHLLDHMLTACERSDETRICLESIIETLVIIRDSYKEGIDKT